MPFHRLIHHGDFVNEHIIDDCDTAIAGIDPTIPWDEIEGYEEKIFDTTVFWTGGPFDGRIPDFVKLYLAEEHENLPQASLLANPISWWIFSERLLDFTRALIERDVQVFNAPVFRPSDGERVPGYKIINPIRVIDCVDWDRSEVSRRKDGTVACMGKVYVKENSVGDHHIFRLRGRVSTVIVSDTFAQSLVGQDFKGIAFVRCGVSP